jgi:multiple sugar transport system permease protein
VTRWVEIVGLILAGIASALLVVGVWMRRTGLTATAATSELRQIGGEARLLPGRLRDLARDPDIPRSTRWLIIGLGIYLASPIDLIPDFVPVIGYLDDVVIVLLVLRRLRRSIPESVWSRHFPGRAMPSDGRSSPVHARPLRASIILSRLFVWMAIALALFWTLFPIWWAFVYSVRPTDVGYRSVFLPFADFHPTLAHWRWEWTNRNEITGLGAGLRNSVIVSTGTAFSAVILGLTTAIGLRSFRQARSQTGAIVTLILLPRIVPMVVLITPLYLLTTALHVHDSLAALIFVNTAVGLPIVVLVIDTALRDLPSDVLAAALLDGASTIRMSIQIIAPMISPVLWAVGVLTFAFSWNEFMFAVTNAYRNAATAPIAIAFLDQRDGLDFEHIGSHIVLIIIIPLLLASITQRVLVSGLGLGAVRG